MALMVRCPQHQHGAIRGFYGSYTVPISSTTRFPSSISLSIFRASCCSRAASALVRAQKLELRASNRKSRLEASLFPFLRNNEEIAVVKEELLEAIRPLDRGAEATPDDESRIDKIANKLESMNPTKEPLKSTLLNGKWELLYTTSKSILKKERPKFLRPNGSIYQAINADTLRAQNMETWPYFNQVTANLTPINQRRVGVKFDKFKVFGLISINAPGRARGELEITYLDEDLRQSVSITFGMSYTVTQFKGD